MLDRHGRRTPTPPSGYEAEALQIGQDLLCLLEANLLGRRTNDAPLEVRHFDGFDLAPTARRIELDPQFHDIIPPTEPVNRRRTRRKDRDFSTPLLSENLAVREDGSILVTAQNKNDRVSNCSLTRTLSSSGNPTASSSP
jgi:hypothetical protein